MRKREDISIGGHSLYIEYNDNSTKFSAINNVNVYRLCMVRLVPKFKISESEGDRFFDEHHSYIIREIKKVINGNSEFYDNFNVNYYFRAGGSQIDPADNVLIDMDRSLDITLKQN